MKFLGFPLLSRLWQFPKWVKKRTARGNLYFACSLHDTHRLEWKVYNVISGIATRSVVILLSVFHDEKRFKNLSYKTPGSRKIPKRVSACHDPSRVVFFWTLNFFTQIFKLPVAVKSKKGLTFVQRRFSALSSYAFRSIFGGFMKATSKMQVFCCHLFFDTFFEQLL